MVPGFGAFLCNYEAAHFDERRRDVILPPARHLAFNRMIADSDGLLAWSVSKRDGVSFEEASVRVVSWLMLCGMNLKFSVKPLLVVWERFTGLIVE